MTSLASLPWYDLAEVRAATDGFWSVVAAQLTRQGLPQAPRELDRREDYTEVWRSPQLLLSQACGYDVRLAFPEHLQVVATPAYRAPGCEGASYRSAVLVGADSEFDGIESLQGRRCVINTRTSHSGMNILRAIIAPHAVDGHFFASVEVSGAHEHSLRAVREGQADVAAIDCVTLELLRRHRPDALQGTRIVHWSEAYPAPPFVTHRSLPADQVTRLRQALRDAIADDDAAAHRDTLLLDRVEELDLARYDCIAELERQALDGGDPLWLPQHRA